MTIRGLLLGFLVAACAPLASPNFATEEKSAPPIWPTVTPLTKEYHFPDALGAIVELSLTDMSGREIYTLHCRPGALILKSGQALTVPDDADFWGDFDCHLHSLYSRDKYESLLIDDPLDNNESHSRGEFYFYELQGSCLEYPEWGRKRSFRLRGMRLQMELFDIQFAKEPPPGRLGSFGFRIVVTPDPSALSAISEPPAFQIPAAQTTRPDPRFTSCDKPTPQHIPGQITEQYIKALGLGAPYPVVTKMSQTLEIDPSRGGYTNPRFFTTESVGHFAQTQIKDQDGVVAYNFECLASRIIGEKAPQIAGDGLSCGLFEPGKSLNLLQDSVDPYSRMSPAIILPKQLEGACSKSSVWGGTRHFRLRGFTLTLTFANPVFGKDEFGTPTLSRTELTIQVETDPSAQTPVAVAPNSYYTCGG